MLSFSNMRTWGARARGAAPLIVGHRGASARAPENSIAAFERAASDGADGVELDVLRCATGEVVVFHDDDLARLGGRPERIAALPWRDLRNIRLRSGATIPTLEEAFEACGPSLLVNVELKASGIPWSGIRDLVEGVAASIGRSSVGSAAHERVLISSFHPMALALWRRRAPSIPCGFLFEHGSMWSLRHAWPLAWLRPACAHPESVLCTPEAVRRWHERGHLVNVWTVDSQSELRRFRDLGVDGIITNDPARARRAIEAQPAGVARHP
jgi:glycerophosphoryl diester phosphodiesterase